MSSAAAYEELMPIIPDKALRIAFMIEAVREGQAVNDTLDGGKSIYSRDDLVARAGIILVKRHNDRVAAKQRQEAVAAAAKQRQEAVAAAAKERQEAEARQRQWEAQKEREAAEAAAAQERLLAEARAKAAAERKADKRHAQALAEAPAAIIRADANDRVYASLEKAGRLMNQGVLTADEFQAIKRKAMQDIGCW